jgi:phasin family protein
MKDKDNEMLAKDISKTMAQGVEEARGAMENYLQFFQKSMSALPWGGTDLSKKIQSYTEQNFASAHQFAQKLTEAKDFQDLVRIQVEFMQTQLKSLSEQAKDLGEIATKATTDAFKGIST